MMMTNEKKHISNNYVLHSLVFFTFIICKEICLNQKRYYILYYCYYYYDIDYIILHVMLFFGHAMRLTLS